MKKQGYILLFSFLYIPLSLLSMLLGSFFYKVSFIAILFYPIFTLSLIFYSKKHLNRWNTITHCFSFIIFTIIFSYFFIEGQMTDSFILDGPLFDTFLACFVYEIINFFILCLSLLFEFCFIKKKILLLNCIRILLLLIFIFASFIPHQVGFNRSWEMEGSHMYKMHYYGFPFSFIETKTSYISSTNDHLFGVYDTINPNQETQFHINWLFTFLNLFIFLGFQCFIHLLINKIKKSPN